jgi:DNA-binding NarL/FixJ family response regulator
MSEHDRKGELTFDHQHRLHQPSEFDGIVDLIEWWHPLRVVVGSWAEKGGTKTHGCDGRATRGPGRGKIVPMTIRIFVLDDHELVRTGLQTLLECEEDMEVVGQAATAQLGLEQIATLQPDVAILDVRLPDGSGIEVCREIRSAYPQIACLMLTSYADDEALFSAIMAGAAGYVLKEIGGSDLIGDIRRVSQGQSLIDATLSKDIFDRLRKTQKTEARLSSLSAQERRVLDLIAQGRSNRQIAEEIFLAEKTVKNYVSSLLSKLGMQRRTEAGVYAAILAERRAANPRNSLPQEG